MRTSPTIKGLDFVLPIIAIRLAAVTLAAWIIVAIHMERDRGIGLHASPPAVSAQSQRKEAPRAADEQLQEMLLHD